jgi:hypothetical protein
MSKGLYSRALASVEMACHMCPRAEFPHRFRALRAVLRRQLGLSMEQEGDDGKDGAEDDGGGGGGQVFRLGARASSFAHLLGDLSKEGVALMWRQRLAELRFLYFLRPTLAGLRRHASMYEEVMASSALRYLLRIVLATGNFLNYHRQRDAGALPASGFSIESCLKLRDVKASDGRNLLHFIIGILARDAPHHLRALWDLAPALERESRAEHATYHHDPTPVVNFARMWLSHRRAGGAGPPPLPPQSPPPPGVGGGRGSPGGSARWSSYNARYFGATAPALAAAQEQRVSELASEMLDLCAKIDVAKTAACALLASSKRANVMTTLSGVVRDLAAASRDWRWAQIAHPRGADAIVAARPDLWNRVCQTDGLNALLGNRDFCATAALLFACAAVTACPHLCFPPRAT